MRKIIKVMVLAALTGSVAWAQPTANPPPGVPPTSDLPSGLPNVPAFQASPQSPVNAVTGRFGTDVDDYLGVTSWSGIEFDSVYFFLGGAAAINSDTDAGGTPINNGVQGGFATRLAGNYLALYYNGTFIDGGGTDNGASDSDRKSAQGQSNWKNNFGFLFGSEAIGGVRLDLLLNGVSANTQQGDSKETWGGPLTTTLQWGKSLGFLTPKVMLGFQWPTSDIVEPDGGDKIEYWSDAALGFTVGVDIGDLGIENTLVINFGDTVKSGSDTMTTSGWFDDQLSVGYGVTLDLTEKFQFKLRPSLTLRLAGNDHKVTPSQGDAYNNSAPQFWLGISPNVEFALKYQRSERLAFYTGLNLSFHNFLAEFDSSYKDQAGTDHKDSPSSWRLNPLSFRSHTGGDTFLHFAATFKFSEALSLEASVESGLIQLGIPGSNAGSSDTSGFVLNNPFDTENVSSFLTAGKLVLNVKF